MSKSNFNSPGSKTDKSKDLDLEGSNQFTFKGEDDTYESFQLSGSKIDIQSDKKSRSNKSTSSHHSIKIRNLLEFSFCGNEHKFNLFDNEINSQNRDDVKRVMIEGLKKINILPMEKKCNNVVKIRFTKAKLNSPKSSKSKYMAMDEIKECINEIKSDEEREGNENEINISSNNASISSEENIKVTLYDDTNKMEYEKLIKSIELKKIIDDINNISSVVVMGVLSEIVDKACKSIEIKEKEKNEKEMKIIDEKETKIIDDINKNMLMDLVLDSEKKEKSDDNEQIKMQKSEDSIINEMKNVNLNNNNNNINDKNIEENIIVKIEEKNNDNKMEEVTNGDELNEIKNENQKEIVSEKNIENVKQYVNDMKFDEKKNDVVNSESLNENSNIPNIKQLNEAPNSSKEKNNEKLNNNLNENHELNIINETNNMDIENDNDKEHNNIKDNNNDNDNMIQKKDNLTILKDIKEEKKEKNDDIKENQEIINTKKDNVPEIKNENKQINQEKIKNEIGPEKMDLEVDKNSNIIKNEEEKNENKMEIEEEEEKNNKEIEEKKEKEKEKENKIEKIICEEKIENTVEKEKKENEEEKLQKEKILKNKEKENKKKKEENIYNEERIIEEKKEQKEKKDIQNEEKIEMKQKEEKIEKEKKEEKTEKDQNNNQINNNTPIEQEPIENSIEVTPKGEQKMEDKDKKKENEAEKKKENELEKGKEKEKEKEKEEEKKNEKNKDEEFTNLPPPNPSLHASKEKGNQNNLLESINSLLEESFHIEEKRGKSKKEKDERDERNEKSESKSQKIFENSNETKKSIENIIKTLTGLLKVFSSEKSDSRKSSKKKNSEERANKKENEKKEKYKIEKKELENDYKLLGRKRNRENIFEISNLIEVNYLNNGKEKAKKNNDEIKEFDMNIHRKRTRKNSISNSNSSKRSNHSIVHNNDIQIIEEEKYDINENTDSEYENKYIFNFNNKKDKERFKLIHKYAYGLLYEKINSKSYSNNNNNLDRGINAMINNEGYKNIKKMIENIKRSIPSLPNENQNEENKDIFKEPKKNKNNIKEGINIKKEEKIEDEFHYNRINNIFYKYNLVSTEGNIQSYVCSLNACKCIAIINKERKEFKIIQKHTILPEQHENFKKTFPVVFMIRNNWKQIHIKKNNENNNYHLDWHC